MRSRKYETPEMGIIFLLEKELVVTGLSNQGTEGVGGEEDFENLFSDPASTGEW